MLLNRVHRGVIDRLFKGEYTKALELSKSLLIANQDLTQRLDAVTEDNAFHMKSVRKLSAGFEELKGANDDLQRQLVKIVFENQEMAKQIAEMDERNLVLNAQCDLLVERNTELMGTVDELTVDELNDSLNVAFDEFTKLRDELIKLKDDKIEGYALGITAVVGMFFVYLLIPG